MLGHKFRKQAAKRKTKQLRLTRPSRVRLPAVRRTPKFGSGYPEVFQKTRHPRLAVPL